MSLNNLQLPPIVLQQLFRYSLIELKTEEQLPPTPNRKNYAVLGNNSNQILIIISSEETLYLPDDQLNFLLGILSACKLTMDDVAILNIKKNTSVTYKLLESELSCKTVLLFGVSAAEIELPLEFPPYQVQRFNNQVYLTGPQLSLLQNDKTEKSKLWNCLKQIFSI